METRRVKRIKVELKGRIEIPEETKKKIGILKKISFKTHDVSLSGALLIVTHYLPKGIEINLIFSEDKKVKFPSLKIVAEVAYCKFVAIETYRLGIKFKKLEEREKKSIQNLLDKYLDKYKEGCVSG